MDWRHKRRWK